MNNDIASAVFLALVTLLVVVGIIINIIEFFFTRKPKYKIVSITFNRVVPSYYGLRGSRVDELIITDTLLLEDWDLGIYTPEGYTYICTNYEIIN